jgi:hypothetical protein
VGLTVCECWYYGKKRERRKEVREVHHVLIHQHTKLHFPLERLAKWQQEATGGQFCLLPGTKAAGGFRFDIGRDIGKLEVADSGKSESKAAHVGDVHLNGKAWNNGRESGGYHLMLRG